MSETQNIIQGQPQPKIRDRLFIAIFGKDTERGKRWRLDLYNALNGTNYTDPDALKLNTIENVIFVTMYNDVSFLVDSQMTLYEQQSRPNANMPLRGLFYFSQLYQRFISDNKLDLHRSSLIKIPNPRFVVFYNGEAGRAERYEMRLSNAFEQKDGSGKFEWTADVININTGMNESLVKKCKPLYDYVRLVGRISANQGNDMEIGRAVREAVEWACEQDLLDGFVREQKENIIGMCLTEFNEEIAIQNWREDGIIEGRAEGAQAKAVEAARNMLKKNYKIPDIAEITGLPIEQVLDLQKELADSKRAAFSYALNRQRLAFTRLLTTDMVICAGPGNPYYNAPSVTAEDLTRLRFVQSVDDFFSLGDVIVLPAGTGKSAPLRCAVRTNSDRAMLRLLETTDLCNLSSYWFRTGAGQGKLRLIPVAGYEGTIQFGYVSARQEPLSEQARAFVDHVAGAVETARGGRIREL